MSAGTAKDERQVLLAVLETPVSPELVPPGAGGELVQKTEELVGPYELVDFYLHGLLRHGAGPRKLLFLAEHAFASRYERAVLCQWLVSFLRRFFDYPIRLNIATIRGLGLVRALRILGSYLRARLRPIRPSSAARCCSAATWSD